MDRHLQFTPNMSTLLENMLDGIYYELQPTRQDYQARKDAIEFVDNLVRQKVSVGYLWKEFGTCHIKAFGSYTMDVFTSTSDLDMSLNVERGDESLTRENKIALLKRLARCLRDFQNGGGHVRDIQPILRANVPIVKFVDCRSGIECDVSAENKDGILKSELLRIFCSLDIRFRKLCFLVKYWAKAHGINSSKDRTLNSLTIILLIGLHLQMRSPPILPPFSVFLKDLHLPTTLGTLLEVQRRAEKYMGFSKNNESVVELLYSFFLKLISMEDLWKQGLCASTYEGKWTSVSNPSFIYVEDFTVRSQNAARAVGEKGFDAIYECLHEAAMHMEKPVRNMSELGNLKELLFNPSVKPSVNPGKRHMDDYIVPYEPKQYKIKEKGVNEESPAKKQKTEENDVFSDIAFWVTFGREDPVNNGYQDKPFKSLIASGNSRSKETTAVIQPHENRQEGAAGASGKYRTKEAFSRPQMHERRKNQGQVGVVAGSGDNRMTEIRVRSQLLEERREPEHTYRAGGFLDTDEPTRSYLLHANASRGVPMSGFYDNRSILGSEWHHGTSRPFMHGANYNNPNNFSSLSFHGKQATGNYNILPSSYPLKDGMYDYLPVHNNNRRIHNQWSLYQQ